jgi:hypothetical protein
MNSCRHRGKKVVVTGEKRNAITAFVRECVRLGYNCTDNAKLNLESMEEAGKPWL